MPQDPWAEFRTGPAQQTPAQPQQAQPQPAYPGVIRGAPRQPDPVTPVQQHNMQVSEERLQLARDAAARSEQAAQRGTVEQGKAASFLERAVHANDNYGALDIGPRSLPGQVFADNFPRIANQFSDADRQRAEQAQREFIQAILRYDSGAAIPETEISSASQTYFPQPGDGPEVIAQKAEARRVAIQGLMASAGPAGERFMQQYSQRERQDAPATAGGIPPASNGGGGGGPDNGLNPITVQDRYANGVIMGEGLRPNGSFDRAASVREIFGLEPSQEDQITAFWNAQSGNDNLTVDAVRGWYQQQGLPAPADADLAAAVESAKQGATFGGLDMRQEEERYKAALDAEIARRGARPEQISDTIGNAGSQGMTLNLADEIEGVGGGIRSAFRGQGFMPGYEAERDLQRRMLERGQDANPRTALASEIVGGLVTGGFRAVPAAMRAASPVAAAAREGAILGGVAGFGHGEGLGDSLVGAGTGAATGAVVGAGLTRAGQAIAPVARRGINRVTEFARGNRPNASEVMPVVQAGERMGVPVRRADVDPAVRDTRAQVLQSPAGQQVRQTEADDLAAMEAALARELGGGARDPYAVGGSIQRGVNRVIDAARARAGRLYDRAANRGQGITIQPNNALAEIDRNIAELTANGPTQNAAAINFLRGVRSDMQRDGGLSIGVMRAQRTNLRGNIEQAGLRATDMERRMTGILQAANSDIQAGLANNPEVAALYSRADALWRQQAEFGQAIGRRLLGTPNQPVSPEQAAQRITAFIGGDFNRARDLIGQIDPATRSEIAAQVAANLGRKANGDFSLATFLTHTSEGRGRLIDERTVRLIFGDDGVRAINDLRILAQAKVAATERTNYSNTGGMVNRMGRGLRTMILGGIGMSEAGLTGGAVAVGASNVMQRLGEARAVRLLTNPDFTRWLRRLPETDNPRAIDGAFERLRSTAARNAQFQSDIQAFEQALIGAANDNTGMAVGVAAQPQDQQQR